MHSMTMYDFGLATASCVFSSVSIITPNNSYIFDNIKVFLMPDRVAFYNHNSSEVFVIDIVTNIIAINSRKFYITTIDFDTFSNVSIEILLNK